MPKENDEMLKRLTELEREVKQLKAQQAVLLKKIQGPVEQPNVENMPLVDKKEAMTSEPVVPKLTEQKQVLVERENLPKKGFDLEGLLSKWLPKVFMFILLLGVLWGLKVASDYGFITQAVRVIAGYAGAALLYYFGYKFSKQENRVFGLTLLGGFIGLGILTTFAAHHLYGYFNFLVAFSIGIIFIVKGLYLSWKTKSEVLTLFSAIAGFLLPFLLEGQSVSVYGFCIYILLLFMSLYYVSLVGSHKYTFYITFLCFHLTLLVYLLNVGSFVDQTAIVITVFIQHFILLIIYFTKKISRHAFTEALMYTNFVFTLGWTKALDSSLMETWAYGSFALFYVVLAMIAFMNSEKLLSGVFSAVATLAISTFILSVGFTEPDVTILLLLINGALSIWVGLRFKTMRTIITGSFVYILSASIVFMFMGIYELLSLEHLIWLVYLASVVFIFSAIYKYPPALLKGNLKAVDISLIIGQIIVISYVMRLTALALQNKYLSVATLTHINILVLMVVFGMMYFLYKWPRGIYVVHATIIGFLLVGLSVLFTAIRGPIDQRIIFNLSIEIVYVALLTLIVIAIIKGKFYIRLEKMVQYLSLLLIGVQVVYFIFLNKWYFAVANALNLSLEYSLLAHTFLLFTFAFVSVSVGGRFKWTPVKYFGALLILLCVLKLFFVDLFAVSILIRAILFIIVGVVGLLYSKTLFKRE